MSHVAAKEDVKKAKKENDDAMVQLDKADQDIHAMHEDLNIKIAQLES
jgi:hypothetical protein